MTAAVVPSSRARTETGYQAGHYEGQTTQGVPMPVALEVGRRRLNSFSYSLIGKGPDIYGGNPCFLSGTYTEHVPNAPFALARRTSDPLNQGGVEARVSGTKAVGTIIDQIGKSGKDLKPATGVCTSLETAWTAHFCKPPKSKQRVPHGTPACKQVGSGLNPKPGHYENYGYLAKNSYIALDVKARRVTTFLVAKGCFAEGGERTQLIVGTGEAVDEDGVFAFPPLLYGAFLTITTARGTYDSGPFNKDCRIPIVQWYVHWCAPSAKRAPKGTAVCTYGKP